MNVCTKFHVGNIKVIKYKISWLSSDSWWVHSDIHIPKYFYNISTSFITVYYCAAIVPAYSR